MEGRVVLQMDEATSSCQGILWHNRKCCKDIIAYCLVAIVERKMKLNMEMYDLLRILSVSLLDRAPLVDLLGKSKPAEKLQTVRELSLKFI